MLGSHRWQLYGTLSLYQVVMAWAFARGPQGCQVLKGPGNQTYGLRKQNGSQTLAQDAKKKPNFWLIFSLLLLHTGLGTLGMVRGGGVLLKNGSLTNCLLY